MEDKELISNYYKEAVAGLTEGILNDEILWYHYVDNLPPKLKVVYTISTFHQQVFNGGLHQYFFNAYGQFAFLTLESLKLIKAHKIYEILKKAVQEVNRDQHSIEEFRHRVFNRKLERIVSFEDELSDYLNELDIKYYNLEGEDIEDLMIKYLKTKLT